MTDVLDLPSIPNRARDRIQHLRDITDERRAPLVKISADRAAAWNEKASAEARVAELKRHHSGLLDENVPPLSQLLEVIARQGAIGKRCDARVAELQPGYGHASRLLATLENYVGAHASNLRLYEGDQPQLKNGENAINGLERAARRTRTLLADRREILAAPFPTAEAKKIARQQVAARIEQARPDVTGLMDRLEPIEFPMSKASIAQHGGHPDNPVSINACDPVGLLAWIFPKEFQSALDREIDANGDDAAALTLEQRKAKLAQIDGDILASEREEAHFAELAGLLPREDIDPRAFLALADKCPPPAHDDD